MRTRRHLEKSFRPDYDLHLQLEDLSNLLSKLCSLQWWPVSVLFSPWSKNCLQVVVQVPQVVSTCRSPAEVGAQLLPPHCLFVLWVVTWYPPPHLFSFVPSSLGSLFLLQTVSYSDGFDREELHSVKFFPTYLDLEEHRMNCGWFLDLGDP